MTAAALWMSGRMVQTATFRSNSVMPGLTYRKSGVDIDAGQELVRRIAPAAKRTHRPEILSDLGGFAALASLPENYRDPVLVTGTDGVGTKLKLAMQHDRHDDVGQDLVAMCVNDVIATGAEPFLFLDYYATGRLDVDVAERVIVGIARGCEMAGCALAGGETAEMPGFYQAGEYDLAGFCIGVVERDSIVTGEHIEVGDRLIGLASNGPHSNGYSLIRRIMEDRASEPTPGELDALLAPTRIYARAVAAALAAGEVRGMAHITGGGLLENVPRMFRRPLAADIDLDAWQWPEVFPMLQQAGNVDEMEMLRTFNCGIGYVLAVRPGDEESVSRALSSAGETVLGVGKIVAAGTTSTMGRLVVEEGVARLGPVRKHGGRGARERRRD